MHIIGSSFMYNIYLPTQSSTSFLLRLFMPAQSSINKQILRITRMKHAQNIHRRNDEIKCDTMTHEHKNDIQYNNQSQHRTTHKMDSMETEDTE